MISWSLRRKQQPAEFKRYLLRGAMVELQYQGIFLFAPTIYPTKRVEIRAYTIAAFRVAQDSDQLSLIVMPKPVIDFLVKRRAIRYWKEKEWLVEQPDGYSLTPEGLVLCQSALADQLQTHSANAADVEFWVDQFRTNSSFPRNKRFDG